MSSGNVLHFPRPAVLPDADARAAALDSRRSFIVEAPAGSGKTGLMLQRFLTLLADPAVQAPEEILAATFTRKATHELRERVLEQLRAAHARRHGVATAATAPATPVGDFDRATAALADAALARDAELGWQLNERPWRLAIRTLDSLAGDIVRQLPVLTGGGGRLSATEDAEPLLTEAAQRTFAHLGDATDPALNGALNEVLRHRAADLGTCTALLSSMLRDREQWARLLPFTRDQRSDERLDKETRPQLERALGGIITAALYRVQQAASPAWLSRLCAFVQTHAATSLSTGAQPGRKDSAQHPLQLCAQLHATPGTDHKELATWTALAHVLLTGEGSWRKPKGMTDKNLRFVSDAFGKQQLRDLIADVEADDELREAFCALRSLPPASYTEAEWHVLKALFTVLAQAAVELRVLFAERGVCDFTEKSLAAREALERHASPESPGFDEFFVGFGTRLRHLLIDEMQDTSATQYDLLQGLTASWDGHSQTLFLVGDPKQSIYAFRQARVERFNRTRREGRLGSVPLTPLTLTANFRSSAALVGSFNRTFEAIFPAPASAAEDEAQALATASLDPPFTPAVAFGAPPAQQLEAQWHVTIVSDLQLLPGTDPDDEAALRTRLYRETEAATIAQLLVGRIESARAAGARPPKLAVLVRLRSHAADILPALRAAGVPYRALGMEPLATRPEVLNLLALTRALHSAADRTAWLAVLRAPWCGVGLADLLALAGDFATSKREALPHCVAERRSSLSAEGAVLFDRAWPALAAARDRMGREPLHTLVERTWRSLGGDAALNETELSNARQYLTLLRYVVAGSDTGVPNLRRLDAKLARLYAAASTTPDAVDVLTMHGAKGLEWDMVLLPSLERRGKPDSARLLDWLERDAPSDAEADIILAPINSTYDDTGTLTQYLRTARTERTRAELKRLLYVACTRAREELHLFASLKRKADGDLCASDAGSLLRAAWPAVAGIAEAAAASATQPAGIALMPMPVRDAGEGLALAAAGAIDDASSDVAPTVERYPVSFDPRARLQPRSGLTLTTPTTPLRRFPRPEGSYRARAVGNVVHRYLDLLSTQLAADVAATGNAAALQADVATWLPRLTTALRGEGLSPADAHEEATLTRRALAETLADPAGRWLLSPHAAAVNELALRLAAEGRSGLRIDRTFVAPPLDDPAAPPRRWIIDWKTSAQSSAVPANFDATERRKYAPQLETYARAFAELDPAMPIQLALYYPLLPRLITWPAGAAEETSLRG